MKVRVSVPALIGLMLCNLAGQAQTNPVAAEATEPVVPAETGAEPAAGAGATNALAPRGALIPLIVMDEVLLTDAIGNLARQAGLNYLMDPKVGFGQPGPDGKLVAQPSVTLRWENLSAEQALNALLNNYSLQMVEDPKSKVARITIRDPAAPPLLTKIVQLRYASPTNMLASVTALLHDNKQRSRVLADVRTSQLVVIATEDEMGEVDRLIESLDSPTKQVLIEARLLETSVNPSTTKGVDWTGTLQGQNISFGNGVMSGTSTTTSPGSPTTTTLPGGRQITSMPGSSTSTILDSVLGNGGFGLSTASGLSPATGFLNADGVRAVLSFLNTYAEARILSSPRTVTLDNETAIIEVGTMFPIVNTTAGTVNVAGGSQISYSNLTVRLDVTPRISANNYVQLRVSPTIIRLGSPIKTTVGDAVSIVYQFNKRQLNTTVMIPSGSTLVMGGLIEDNIQENNTKVPVLGDIPGIGLLFRNDTKTRQKSNLIVFLTPTIVSESDFQPAKTGYLKTPAPKQDFLEPDWKAWDSGKPKDWSKPKPQKESPTDSALDQGPVPPPSPTIPPPSPTIAAPSPTIPPLSPTIPPSSPTIPPPSPTIPPPSPTIPADVK